ncbi:uncharacterized protein LOC126784378 isoform X2 [Argentina anserina]|uniref:uncharacterized protein LOC126784378 isoform X2 n=1 Tax=Argentina anserina TaxID=57926 RepID=UPI00217680B8|nr:uncharacterized protein LOC126784378 isoform X2 [Potentilla anserina]
MSGDDDSRKRRNQWPPAPARPYENKEEDMKIWGIFIFGFIGATATTLALFRSPTWRAGSGGSHRKSFQEEAWKRYNRRMQEEYEEELERVERIRRMQSVFNRERNKYKRGYESWRENGQGQSHQHFQREDWYWKTETAFKDRRSNYRETPREHGNYLLSQHYSILGLDRFRKAPYTDAEIKTAFRTKAKEFHPDQNQDNKDAAEAKFKEVMMSYEAIKKERGNL